MKRILITLLLVAFSFPVLADAIADARSALNLMSAYGPNPKILTNAQMLSIVTKYNTANGFSNPWNQETNPTEFAAWPTNLERATFFLQKLGGEIRSDIGSVAGRDYDTTSATARAAAIKAAEDEL